jgi:hypothetical protein
MLAFPAIMSVIRYLDWRFWQILFSPLQHSGAFSCINGADLQHFRDDLLIRLPMAAR